MVFSIYQIHTQGILQDFRWSASSCTFSENKVLFPLQAPPVYKVPGRQHKVVIHYNRRTPGGGLGEYITEAFKKTVKIHKKLPRGGILVFVTGIQEVIGMVNKLRMKFSPRGQDKLQNGRDPGTGEQDEGSLEDEWGEDQEMGEIASHVEDEENDKEDNVQVMDGLAGENDMESIKVELEDF